MIEITLLKNHPYFVPSIANIWHENLGKIWMPEIKIKEVENISYAELEQDTPITYIALCDKIPTGSCALQLNEDIRPDLGPWIGDLVIDEKYRSRGVGKMLLDVVIKKAKDLGFNKIYLFTFDVVATRYYQNLGWKYFGKDRFKSHSIILMERNI